MSNITRTLIHTFALSAICILFKPTASYAQEYWSGKIIKMRSGCGELLTGGTVSGRRSGNSFTVSIFEKSGRERPFSSSVNQSGKIDAEGYLRVSRITGWYGGIKRSSARLKGTLTSEYFSGTIQTTTSQTNCRIELILLPGSGFDRSAEDELTDHVKGLINLLGNTTTTTTTPTPTPTPTPSAPTNISKSKSSPSTVSITKKLKIIKGLLEKGLITKEEAEKKRAKLLEEM